MSAVLEIGSLIVASDDVRGGRPRVTGNVVNEAIVRPGTSAGALTITGNYTQTVAGTLSIEIGGAGAGIGYDQLRVNGIATLDGTLQLLLINGFNPAVGSSFVVLRYGSVVDEFALIIGFFGDFRGLNRSIQGGATIG